MNTFASQQHPSPHSTAGPEGIQPLPITLMIHNNIIYFARVKPNTAFKADQKGPGNDPANSRRTPTAMLQICDEASGRSTLHTILSDGNIIRTQGPDETPVQDTMDDDLHRVIYAIAGTVLAHCDNNHVLQTWTDPLPVHVQFKGRVHMNRHQLLKIFYAIQPTHAAAYGLHKLRTYRIRSYTCKEIHLLFESALRRGMTFSAKPVSELPVPIAQLSRVSIDRQGVFPADLMLLAHVAGKVEEAEQRIPLFWN